MENASKALLIAASILIAILLIAVAVKVLSSSNTDAVIDTTSLTAEVSQHNKTIERFLGENMSKQDTIESVSSLFTFRTNTSRDSSRYLKITNNTGVDFRTYGSFSAFMNADENPNQRYKLEINSVDEDGFIVEVKLSYQD